MSKSRAAAMSMSSFIATILCNAWSPIASKSLRMSGSSWKPGSRVSVDGSSFDAAYSASQVRLHDAYFGGMKEEHQGNLTHTKEQISEETDDSESGPWYCKACCSNWRSLWETCCRRNNRIHLSSVSEKPKQERSDIGTLTFPCRHKQSKTEAVYDHQTILWRIWTWMWPFGEHSWMSFSKQLFRLQMTMTWTRDIKRILLEIYRTTFREKKGWSVVRKTCYEYKESEKWKSSVNSLKMESRWRKPQQVWIYRYRRGRNHVLRPKLFWRTRLYSYESWTITKYNSLGCLDECWRIHNLDNTQIMPVADQGKGSSTREIMGANKCVKIRISNSKEVNIMITLFIGNNMEMLQRTVGKPTAYFVFVVLVMAKWNSWW